VDDPERATPIDVQPGSEVSGRNLWLSPLTTFRVQGHIADSRGGKPSAGVFIAVISNVRGESLGVANYVYAETDGSFELRDVLPGNYTMVVTSGSPQQGAAGLAGYGAFRVTNSDVKGVSVTLAQAGVLSGRVVVEGQEGAGTLPIEPPELLLQPVMDGVPLETPNVPGTSLYVPSESGAPGFYVSAITNGNGYTTNVIAYKRDGTFRIEDLLPGRYRLSLSADYSIKEANFNGRDVLAHDLLFDGSPSGPLTIVLASRTGSVAGQISFAKAEQQGRATVVFVPDGMRERPDRLTVVRSSADGNFEATKILPGDYRVFAWIDVEPNAYLNPEFRAQFEAHGLPIHVTEGVNPVLSLKVASTAIP
jgi:5-hydroxyisourate hydrolase-like protein (transthyretin family)